MHQDKKNHTYTQKNKTTWRYVYMSKTSTKVLIAIAAVVLVLVFWFVGTKNSLVSLKEDVSLQQAQIETTLQRRCDLIPNLVASVKGYTSHEEKVFTEIADARSKLAGSIESGDMDEINTASQNLDSALSRLLAISESYPDLKASDQFIALQDELAGTENRITVARQYYNESVRTYNAKVQRFPTSIIAGICGYSPLPYFEASSDANEAPVVSFD